jgi:hypothetical protein
LIEIKSIEVMAYVTCKAGIYSIFNRVASSHGERPYELRVFRERSITLEGKLFSLKRNDGLRASIATYVLFLTNTPQLAAAGMGGNRHKVDCIFSA